MDQRYFEEHISMVSKILELLQENGLQCNPLKCDWAVEESDFLGYWMTPEGFKPKLDKIEAVLKLGRPRNQMQVRSFLCTVTFYKYMFPRRSHVLYSTYLSSYKHDYSSLRLKILPSS